MSGIEPSVIWGGATSLLKSLFSPTYSFIIFIILTRCYFSFYLDFTGSLQNERERSVVGPTQKTKNTRAQLNRGRGRFTVLYNDGPGDKPRETPW